MTAAVLLALATTGAVVALGSCVGSLNPRGWTRVALAACLMAGLAASAAVSLTLHRSSSGLRRDPGRAERSMSSIDTVVS